MQAITPSTIVQVWSVCECEAAPLHEDGLTAAVAVIVTLPDGVKPCIEAGLVAVPLKYAPLLSAAYCSS
jgi:hypothetical protein